MSQPAKREKPFQQLLTVQLCLALLVPNHSLGAEPTERFKYDSRMLWTGTNLSGAEFGSDEGAFGRSYIYPSSSDLDFVATAGMNIVRLPVRWERLQPSLFGSLADQELRRLKQFIGQAEARDISVIIDVHNYARYRGQLIGSETVPHSAFADLWFRLALQFGTKPTVALGLMNEPHGIDSKQWLEAVNVAIAAIRRSGAQNLVLAPGIAWTGAHSWNSTHYGTPNGETMLGVLDSLGNTAIEVHQYLDGDSSGTSSDCVNTTVGKDRLAEFTQWAKRHKVKAFLAEFGSGPSKTCEAAVSSMLSYMNANSEVWIGWSWWSAGPWWGDYPLSIQPSADGTAKTQLSWLTPFLVK